jgi:hypothetical protein
MSSCDDLMVMTYQTVENARVAVNESVDDAKDRFTLQDLPKTRFRLEKTMGRDKLKPSVRMRRSRWKPHSGKRQHRY